MKLQNDDVFDCSPPVMVVGLGDSGLHVLSLLRQEKLRNLQLLVLNTNQASLSAFAPITSILIGETITGGLGTGGNPRLGRRAVEASSDALYHDLAGAKTVIITTGLGGGTGTGAAPALAHIAQELGALVIGVISCPFGFEGPHRQQIAAGGLALLQKRVDHLDIVQNDHLFRFMPGNPPVEDAYLLAAKALAWQVLARLM